MALTGDTFDLVQGGIVTQSAQIVDNGATVGDVLTVQADKSIAAAPGGGSQPIEYIVTDYTVADVVEVGGPGGYAVIGPVVTLAPGDGFLAAGIEITEAWADTGLTIQLTADPAGDISQAYNQSTDGGGIADTVDGTLLFRTGGVSAPNSTNPAAYLPGGASPLPIYVNLGVLFGDQGAIGALTVRFVVVRAA